MDTFITVAFAVTIAYVGHAFYRARNPSHPGPPGYPIFGNLLQLGSTPQHTLTAMYRKYGDAFTLKMGSIDWVVLNTTESFRQVLVSQAPVASSRPYNHVAGDILSFGHRSVATLPYGDEWNLKRKIFALAMSRTAVKGLAPILEYESALLAHHLLEDSTASTGAGIHTLNSFKCFALNGLFGGVFGCRKDSAVDPTYRALLGCYEEEFAMTSAERFSTDFFPILKPLLPLFSRSFDLRDRRDVILAEIVQDLRDRLADPTQEVPDCMGKTIIEAADRGELSHIDTLSMTATVMGAGTDTSAGSINWLALILAIHPEIQAKLHAEMDRVVGRDRLPTHADIDDLTYLRATMKECARLHPPGYLSIPRLASENIVYKDRLIPKGAWIMSNIYAIAHDEAKFPDPFVFRPERWEGKETSICSDAMGPQDDRDIWYFGAGRRICVGMYLAEMEIFLAFATIIATLHVGIGKDEVIDISQTLPGLTQHAFPRRLTFTSRYPDAEILLAGSLSA